VRSGQFLQHDLNLADDFRDLDGNDPPDQLHVDPEVVVDKAMPEARDALPRNLTEEDAGLTRDTTRRLSEDLQLTDHRVLDDLARFELGLVYTLDMPSKPGDCVQHVPNVDRLIQFAHRSPKPRRESVRADRD